MSPRRPRRTYRSTPQPQPLGQRHSFSQRHVSPHSQRDAAAAVQPQRFFSHEQSFWLSSFMVGSPAIGALDCALHWEDADAEPALQVQSRQPCSAHVPHDRTTCLRSASRARKMRTAALFAVSPFASA